MKQLTILNLIKPFIKQSWIHVLSHDDDNTLDDSDLFSELPELPKFKFGLGSFQY